MIFVNIQVLTWFINYVITNTWEGSPNMTLCWCVLNVRQINVYCNIHIT